MALYKAGDQVRVRRDLKLDKRYKMKSPDPIPSPIPLDNGYSASMDMCALAGEIVTIDHYSYLCHGYVTRTKSKDKEFLVWTDEMFEEVQPIAPTDLEWELSNLF